MMGATSTRLLLSAVVIAFAAAAPAQAQAQAQDGQIKRALLGNPWCNFTYNKVSGASRSQRAVFSSNGTLVIGGSAETYSSGRAGTYAGQSSRGQRYYWNVQNGHLLLSEDGRNWQPLELDAKQNSSGNIILMVDGDEWAACN